MADRGTSLNPSRGERGKLSKAHVYAPKQEAKLAKRLGGRQVKGSGSGYEKGDVRVSGIARIEAKTTKHKSFSITQSMWEKIEDAALSSDEIPAIVVEFLDPSRELAVVPVWALERLIERQHGPV